MRRLLGLTFVVTMLLGQAAHAQTVLSVVTAAGAVESLLNSTVANLGTEGRSVVGLAVDGLNGAMDQLKQLVQGDLNQDINTLSDTGKNLARTIQNTTDQLNNLLQVRLACGVQDAQFLLGGLRTITSQLQTALPLVKSAKPFLTGFTFDGHHNGIVPSQGGRVVIVGFGLFNKNVAPIVKLTSTDGNTVLVTFSNQTRGQDDNSVAVVLDSDTVSKLTGGCGLFNVTPRRKKLLGGLESLPSMNLPLCVPPILNSKVSFNVHADYETDPTGPEVKLPSQNFRCDNSSCEDRGGCNVQKTFTLPNPDCQVLREEHTPGQFMRNNSNVTLTINGSQLTAAGTLDTATCVNFSGPFSFGHHLSATTIYDMNASLVVKCPQNQQSHNDASSPAFDLSSEPSPAPICVNFQRPSDLVDASYSTELFMTFNGKDPLQIGGTQAIRFDSPSAGGNPPDVTFDGVLIKAAFQPLAGLGFQACVRASAQSCGY